jgi:16S rRNA (uracil1498-N3)-methyltransferase
LSPGAKITLADCLAAVRNDSAVALLIGSEGGLAEVEREITAHAGFEECSLGPRVLRTETASLAALAAIHALRGDFRRDVQ